MNAKTVISHFFVCLILAYYGSGCAGPHGGYGSRIHKAAAQGDHQALEAQLAKGETDVNLRNDKGETPLYLACAVESADLSLVKRLVSAGADVHAATSNEQEPLKVHRGLFSTFANRVERNRWAMERQLVGATPLHVAAKSRNVGIVKYLLDNGADIQAKTFHGNSVLHTAFFTEQNRPMIEFLLQHGLSLTSKNTDGETPGEAGARYLGQSAAMQQAIMEFNGAATALAGGFQSANAAVNAATPAPNPNANPTVTIDPASINPYTYDSHGHINGPGLTPYRD